MTKLSLDATSENATSSAIFEAIDRLVYAFESAGMAPPKQIVLASDDDVSRLKYAVDVSMAGLLTVTVTGANSPTPRFVAKYGDVEIVGPERLHAQAIRS